MLSNQQRVRVMISKARRNLTLAVFIARTRLRRDAAGNIVAGLRKKKRSPSPMWVRSRGSSSHIGIGGRELG